MKSITQCGQHTERKPVETVSFHSLRYGDFFRLANDSKKILGTMHKVEVPGTFFNARLFSGIGLRVGKDVQVERIK